MNEFLYAVIILLSTVAGSLAIAANYWRNVSHINAQAYRRVQKLHDSALEAWGKDVYRFTELARALGREVSPDTFKVTTWGQTRGKS